MIITNHFLVGVGVATIVSEPALALPLAFASHFGLDALPHWGYDGGGYGQVFKHRAYKVIIGMSVTSMAVSLVWLARSDEYGWLAMVAGLVAISPDLMWPYRYFLFERQGKTPPGGPITRFHQRIQWMERPWGMYVEFLFLAVMFMVIF